MGESSGVGLDGRDASVPDQGTRSALGPALACLPGSRSSSGASGSAAGDCQRQDRLRARPARAPANSAHPGADAAPAESKLSRPHQPAATEPRITPGAPPRVRIPLRPGRLGPSLPSRLAAALASAHREGGADLKTHSPHRLPVGIPYPQPELQEGLVFGPGRRFERFLRPLALSLEEKPGAGNTARKVSSSSLVCLAPSGRYPRSASSLLGWRRQPRLVAPHPLPDSSSPGYR